MVWSLTRHPNEPDTLFAGYETTAIFKSTDNGRIWHDLDVSVDYPAIAAGPEMPRHVTRIAVDPRDSARIYAGIEIGGLIVSKDAGDLQSVLVDGDGRVSVATRVGAFQSEETLGSCCSNQRVILCVDNTPT